MANDEQFVMETGVRGGLADRHGAALPEADAPAQPAPQPADDGQSSQQPVAAEMSTSRADRAANQTLTDFLHKPGNRGCPLPGKMIQDQAQHLAELQDMNSQQLAIAQVTATLGCLAKLTQIEKAVFFGEKRQDAGVCLPSERMRHLHQYQDCVDSWLAEPDSNPDKKEKLALARQELRKHQWDSLACSRQYGCLHQTLAAFQLFFPSFSKKLPCLRVAE